MAIRSIMCCCGSGLGSSMMVSMNVEKALKNLGITGVSVDHTSLSEVNPNSADLFVVGRDLAPQVASYPSKIILDGQKKNLFPPLGCDNLYTKFYLRCSIY